MPGRSPALNLLVLEPAEIGQRLPRSDRRWVHLRKVLRKGVGAGLRAGIAVDSAAGPAPGALGSATVLEMDEEGVVFGYRGEGEPPPLAPLRVLLGFPRPVQANRILKDLASLGVAGILLTGTELGEKSYLDSGLYGRGEWRRPLLEGAEQAGNPRLPAVAAYDRLGAALDALEASAPSGEARRVLHPGTESSLWASLPAGAPCLLAIGSERGWTAAELGELRGRGFLPASLGARILKTETAAVAAVAVALARLALP